MNCSKDPWLRRFVWIWLAAIGQVSFGATGILPVQAQASGDTNRPPLIVAGSYPAYCLAVKAAGPLARIEVVGGTETGPHGHQLTPSELRKLEEARLVVLLGLGLEGWAEKYRAMRGSRTSPVIVECAAGLSAELITGDDRHGHAPGEGHEHASAGFNPHIWLDPVLARHAVRNIERALVQTFPEQADAFRKQARAGEAELETLHQQIESALKEVRIRKVVTYHDAFPYFFKRFQLQSADVVQPQADASPTPRTLARLAKRMREEKIRVVFTEPQFNPAHAQRLARDLGVETASLDTLETGELDPRHYDRAMLLNARTLARFLR
ncbi:MAG: hypothetical protein FJ404_08870 [Verrucomicrobia bacterium]|nr:hypothetical protein [Verrucomicrobiota bacterium]